MPQNNQLTINRTIIGLLASALLVIFGLYIISKANVLADTVTKPPPLDLNTLVPYSIEQIPTGQNPDPNTEYVQSYSKFNSVKTIIGTVFDLVISIGGGIFVLLLLIGGIIYLTGAGNDEQTGKAKKMMIDAVIGLFIILASWGIGSWVINAFTVDDHTGTTQTGSGTGTEEEKAPTPSGDLPPSEGGSNPNDAANRQEEETDLPASSPNYEVERMDESGLFNPTTSTTLPPTGDYDTEYRYGGVDSIPFE